MAEMEKEEAEQLKKQGDVKDALQQATPPPETMKLLKKLNAEPDRVGFPKGNTR